MGSHDCRDRHRLKCDHWPFTVRIVPKSLTVSTSLKNRLVAAVAYDGLGAFEFGVVSEVFGLARPELGAKWYRFAACAAEPGPLRSVGGIQLHVDRGLDLLKEAGTVIIPAWRDPAQPAPPALLEALRGAHARGTRLVSICSGAFVLAAAGVLAGKRATTHWRHAPTLASAFPDIAVEADVLYVDEGNVLTSAGSAAGIDLCLHIVRTDFGPEIANHVARRLVMAPHRDGGQGQFIETPVPTVRERSILGPLLDRMRSRLQQPQSIGDLAAEAHMSVRTFLRRFHATTGMTPGEWLLAQRLSRARELLEATTHSIERVATLSGFGSAATLRLHFRNRLGVSPVDYRARFSHR
jgi:AraC family transcriptional regulator, transcriptional activator FtrA